MNPGYAFAVWVGIGGITGWLGGLLLGRRQSSLSDVVAGVAGAACAGAASSQLLSVDTALPGYASALVGACLAVWLWNLFKNRPMAFTRTPRAPRPR